MQTRAASDEIEDDYLSVLARVPSFTNTVGPRIQWHSGPSFDNPIRKGFHHYLELHQGRKPLRDQHRDQDAGEAHEGVSLLEREIACPCILLLPRGIKAEYALEMQYIYGSPLMCVITRVSSLAPAPPPLGPH